MDNRQIFYKSMIWKILNNPIMSNKSMKNPNSVRKTAIEKPAAEVCLCSDTHTHTHTHTHTEEQRWISILEQKIGKTREKENEKRSFQCYSSVTINLISSRISSSSQWLRPPSNPIEIEPMKLLQWGNQQLFTADVSNPIKWSVAMQRLAAPWDPIQSIRCHKSIKTKSNKKQWKPKRIHRPSQHVLNKVLLSVDFFFFFFFFFSKWFPFKRGRKKEKNWKRRRCLSFCALMAGATWNIYLFILEIFYLQEEMKKKKKDRQTKKIYIY